jgi:hypothetical protein
MKYKKELLKSARSAFSVILGVAIGTLLVKYFFNSEFNGLSEIILYLSLYILAFIISTLLNTLIEIHITKKKSR